MFALRLLNQRGTDTRPDPTLIRLVRIAWSFDERGGLGGPADVESHVARLPALRPGVPGWWTLRGMCGPL